MDRRAERMTFLIALFPEIPLTKIQEVERIVIEQTPRDTPDEQLENMFDMLHNIVTNSQHHIVGEDGMLCCNCNTNCDTLRNLFPNTSLDEIREYCNLNCEDFDMDHAITRFTEGGNDTTPKMDKEEMWNSLKEVLPGADPSYLKEQVDKLAGCDQSKLQEFLVGALETNDYPTMDEYLRRKQNEKNIDMYKEGFSVNQFLEVIPNPETYFRHPKRKHPLQAPDVSEADTLYALTTVYNKYPYIRKRHIDLVFRLKKKNLLEVCCHLDKVSQGLKHKRDFQPLPNDCENLPLLQEIAYVNHKEFIRRVLKYKNQVYQQFMAECSDLGMVEKCGICDDELIPDECFYCNKRCMFCKECVRRYVEVRMGDGHNTFPCCNNCDSEFGIHILQMVLPQSIFARLLLKIQSDEIKRANVDGLETCPFCEFASIPSEASNIFKCESPECGKESCRLCRHESHVPKRCSEIEYDEDVRMRTFIEDKMTEALTRTCYSCQKKFIKTSGCNKMTCSCGAMMCYLCSQPVKSYDHFGGTLACQLFTNDVEINLNRIRQNAERAKKELGDAKIKFDPTIGIENYFPS